MIGLSWLGVPTTARPEPSCTSQAQPEPNWPTPVSFILSWNSENEPNASLIASASAPSGSPPPSGDIDSQNSVWLRWPPPLLRTGPRLSSGTSERLAITSSIGLSASSVPSSAAFALST